MKELTSRIVVVTGASSGIGLATAIAFAKQKCKIAICARRLDRLQNVADQIREGGADCFVSKTDVSIKEDVDRFISEVLERWARIDVLVCNAGYGYTARIDEITAGDMEQIFAVNFLGTLFPIQAALPPMKKQKYGHIVIVSSVAGRYALPVGGAYSVTKFAQVALSQSLRAEVRADGIRVTAIYPGFTETEFSQAAFNPGNRKTKSLGKRQPAEEVGEAIVRAVKKNKKDVYPNLPGSIFAHAGMIFPSLVDRIMSIAGKRMGRI